MIITITISQAIEDALLAKLATLTMTDIRTVEDYVSNLIKGDLQALIPFVPDLKNTEDQIQALMRDKHTKLADLANGVSVAVERGNKNA